MRVWTNIILLIPATTLLACGDMAGDDVQTYPVEEFSMLTLGREVDATIRLCADCDPEVELIGHKSAFEKYRVEVDDRELVVRRKPAVLSVRSYPVDATITAPSLAHLRITGDNNVEAAGITGSRFELFTNGRATVSLRGVHVDDFVATLRGEGEIDVESIESETVSLDVRRGDIVMAGVTNRVEVKSSGDDQVDLLQLRAREVDLTLRGDGNFDVCADKTLDVSIRGDAQVRYACDPDDVQASGGDGGSVLPL